MGFDKRFMVMAAALAGCGALVAVGHMQQPVGFGSVLELWGDVLRDVDQAGLKLAPAAPDEEMRLGDELSKGVWGVAPLQTEDSLKVDRIGQRLVPFVRRGAIRYHFAVVDSPEINAFALPGGRVFVTNGMLGFVQSDDELASVIGHEMAHVDLRHCIERYQVALKARKLHLGDLGEVVQAARMLAAVEYSKYQEMDADAEGVRLAQAAGYDPRAAVRLFQRMARQAGEPASGVAGTPSGEVTSAMARALSEYFRSHPSSLERSEKLNNIIER